ncbi:COREPRESSOR [Salix viminalis]|uniref:COREPRESSOR n=1 Tax=Salix viminalis TaxID=40686 RepID=A0A9Q0SI15_SALVM|nr:COREPRESSOR [Salix viminalis]
MRDFHQNGESNVQIHDLVGRIRDGLRRSTISDIACVSNADDLDLMLCNDIKEGNEAQEKSEVDVFEFTSWCRFPMYEADFGRGKPGWVSKACTILWKFFPSLWILKMVMELKLGFVWMKKKTPIIQNPLHYQENISCLREERLSCNSPSLVIWVSLRFLKMGKNQAYKAMQRSRLGSSSAGPEEIEDGMVDGSFHSPEWHAARLASLNTTHTVTWEEFKKKQKEDEMRKGELEADKDRMMREYRAQLDAERARKLAHGRNHSGSKSSHKKDRKDRDSKKRSSKKRKNRWSSMCH